MKPILQALLVADHVYIDATSGKKIVAGIFHRLYFRKAEPKPDTPIGESGLIEIPQGGQQAGSPFCYISLTDAKGECRFTLRYVDLSDDSVLLATEFGFDSQDPLRTYEVVLPLPTLPASKPGAYALELLWGDEPLGVHRIIVEEMKKGEQ